MKKLNITKIRCLLLIYLAFTVCIGAYAQSSTIRGKVTDSMNGALPGVTLSLKGTSVSTVTADDGSYSIQAPNGSGILIITNIGYRKQEVSIDNRIVINIMLEQDNEDLEEVVVVGYGTQRRQDVTGAISSIKASDIVTQGANTVGKSLQGKVSGVEIESAGGSPGSGVRILIRGTGSIGNNEPLYIVDGVQVSNINNISPTDIAFMDILKDASAAAIYGSRAANGVVLITTKSGKRGEDIIDFNAYYGVQNITKTLDLLNAKEWALVNNMAHDNAGHARLDIIPNDELLGEGTDWQKEIFRAAPTQNYNLGANGGGENYTYSLSGGYLNQDGIVKETTYDRWNMRLKSDFKKGRIRIGETVILTKEYWRNASGGFGGQGGNPIGSAMKMLPIFDVYDANAIGGYGGAYGPIVNIENPVAVLNLQEPKIYANDAIINAFAEVSIISGLKYKFNVGYTNRAGYNYTYTFPYEMGTLFHNIDADLSESRNETVYSLQEHTLNYDKSFGKHSIQALAGYTYQNTTYRILSGSKSGMPTGIYVLDAGIANTAAGSNAWENALVSYLSRIVYSYDNRYVLTGIIRRDGSSRFGQGNKYGNFPSLALAWNISNESFFESFKPVFSTLKARVSYGELGNQEFADYRFSPTISLNTNYVAGQQQQLWPGAIQTAFATPNIKWESSKTIDVGLDLGFFNNSVFLSTDYFIRKNTDVLLQVPIPLSTGASGNSPYINAGQITNRGLEAALTYSRAVNEFSYRLSGTFTAIKNEVDNLGTGSQQIFGGNPTHHGTSSTVTQKGLPVGAFYLIKTDGLFNSQEAVNAYSHDGRLIQPSAKAGDVKYIDYNKDGKIDQNDRQFLGSPTPKFSYGFGGSLEWKNIDMNIFLQGTYGNKIYNGLRQSLESMNLDHNYLKTTLNAWTPENTNTTMPRAVINDPNLNSQTSDRFLENGSYLRIKTLQIGYTFSDNLLESLKINSFRIYASVDNLFTITNYTGYNPDLGRAGSVLDRGVDRGHVSYPLSRTSMIGVQFTF